MLPIPGRFGHRNDRRVRYPAKRRSCHNWVSVPRTHATIMRSEELHPGDLIAGKYRVRSILGRRHGLLVDAFHTEFDQRVAIKVLMPGVADDKAVERFRREARTLAKLESEHVARILDVGSEDGAFYLVRQYLDGTDLERVLRERGPLPIEQAVLLLLQVADAVAETHSHGIILRELQPSHLWLAERPGGSPLVKIMDFGTAKVMREAAAPQSEGSLTATTAFGLSPYSSPELVRKAKDVDVRTDVWSLGAVFYAMLTARPPFSGDPASMMLQIAKEDPVPVRYFRPELPQEIESVVGWCLAKDVDGRFATVHALAHALAPFASAEGQVLIERIGQTTHAGKQRKRVGITLMPPPGAEAAQSVRDPASAPFSATSRTDRDMDPSLDDAATPDWNTREMSKAALASARVPSFEKSSPTHSTELRPRSSASTRGPNLPERSSRRGLDSRLIAAAAAVLIIAPIVVVILLVRGATSRTPEPSAPEAPTAMVIELPTATPLPLAAAPSVVPAASSIPPVALAAPSASAGARAWLPPPPVTNASMSAPPPAVEDRPAAKPARPVAPPSAAADDAAPSGGANGTLMAVAVGGSCAFSVNGASKGTTSTLKVSLKPGSYTVSCRPASGAAKTKSVTISSGSTSMAMFKL